MPHQIIRFGLISLILTLFLTRAAPVYAFIDLEGKRDANSEKLENLRMRYKNSLESYKDMKERQAVGLSLEEKQQQVSQALNVIIRHLEVMKAQAERLEDSQSKTDILNKINEQIAYFQQQLEDIKTVTSEEELDTLRTTLKGSWTSLKEIRKELNQQIRTFHLQNIIQNLEKMVERVQEVVATKQREGVDLATADSSLTQATQNINQAKEGLTANLAISEIKNYLKTAHQQIREALQALGIEND